MASSFKIRWISSGDKPRAAAVRDISVKDYLSNAGMEINSGLNLVYLFLSQFVPGASTSSQKLQPACLDELFEMQF
jgi:hypothetical protein